MTRAEIIALTQRIATKLARTKPAARPLSDERLKRIEEIRRQAEPEQPAQQLLRA